ncbi:MAG: hypothetical protein LC118_21295 [Dehalococcoidia bacterium]|nr:hypothetical protein [Dehalococcoidia bacterium]
MPFPGPVAAAASPEYRPWRPAFWVLALVAAAGIGLPLGALLSVLWPRDALAPYEYHLWRWEANGIVNNLFARMGIGPDPSDSTGQEAVTHYFALTSAIRAEESRAEPDVVALDALESQRSQYENTVERLIERYIDEAVTSAGLQRGLPLFNAVRLTWPPVDFELTTPPQLLVRSPRTVVRREGDTLLENGLSLSEIQKIEAETADADTVSIVVPIGGIAAYPAIVRDDRSYDSLLDTAAHEWTHHYLAFFPLGEQWGKGGDAETLNETTANIAGREIANLIRKHHPVSLPQGQDGSAPPMAAPTADYDKEMRALRLRVDDLLRQGKVEEAEKAMEDTRQYLAEHGIVIRKINQAYFAFYGTYGDTAASSSPVGPKIERVWSLTNDVGRFLRVMRDVTSAGDLDRAIATLQAGNTPG